MLLVDKKVTSVTMSSIAVIRQVDPGTVYKYWSNELQVADIHLNNAAK